jgi:hypothetical protein
MLVAISMGCLVGLPGCSGAIGGLMSSAFSETAMAVLGTIFTSLLAGLIPAAS